MLLVAALALADPTPSQSIDLVHEVEPRFPREARREKIAHAECVLLVRVTPAGVPDDVHPLTCPDLFVEPTVQAVRKWRFAVVPPTPASFRVVVAYDWPRKEGAHVSLGTAGEVPPEPPIEPVPVPVDPAPPAPVEPAPAPPPAPSPVPGQ